jgi:hypothetical protein
MRTRSCAISTGRRSRLANRDALKVEPPPRVQKEFGDLPAVAVEEVKASGNRVQLIDAPPRRNSRPTAGR